MHNHTMNHNNFRHGLVALLMILTGLTSAYVYASLNNRVSASGPNLVYLPLILNTSNASRTPPPATPSSTPTPNPYDSAEWAMAAANPQRTSRSSEEVNISIDNNSGKVLWYRPIEAYIPQNVQVIAANGLVFIATAKGLYALSADSGDVAWRYDTELPLGNSPTVYKGVAYVGGMDHRIHAIDASTGQRKWVFDQARAGFATNPLVLDMGGKTVVFIGSRDGAFYAIEDDGSSWSSYWSQPFQTGGPIMVSAAYKDNTIYFASNDNYAYAINATTGTKVWRSAKLLGEGFDSYWPVVYTDRFTGKDFVVFSGAVSYRMGPAPGIATIENAPYNFVGWGAWSGDQKDILKKIYSFTGPLPTRSPANQWEQGKKIVNGKPLIRWLEDYPDPSAQAGNRGKPWQRTTFLLNAGNGSEYTFDSNGNGKLEHAPFAFWGTRSGNRYPPIVGPDNVLYTGNINNNSGIAGQPVMGWETGTPYFSLISALTGAIDEPQALSFGGNIIYRSICCDRYADWSNYVSGSHGQLYGYNSLANAAPGYDDMWYADSSYYPRWEGWYTGSRQYFYGRSGVYHNIGDQNPVVPYQGKLFIHRSNAIIAFGPSTAPAYGNKGDLRISSIADSSIPVPTVSDLKDRLTAEIQKMIAAGDLRPGYYNNGQASMSGLDSYFENPGDTLYTLTMAYPYVSPTVQPQLLTYIKQEFANYFNPTMYVSRGWTGKPREAFGMPPEVQADMKSKPKRTDTDGNYSGGASTAYSMGKIYPQFNLYAIWKYAQLVPADTLTAYTLAKSKLDVPSRVADDEFTAYPWVLNSYVGGYIGFLNLQTLAGMATTDSTLRTLVSNELIRLENLRAANLKAYLSTGTANPNTCIDFMQSHFNYNDLRCRQMNIGRNFWQLVPELGDYLNQYALSAAQSAIAELTYVAPYWFQEGYTSTHLEGVKEPLYDVDLLLGKAFILKQSYAELSKYLDAPTFAAGDLLYMQNLIAVLSAQ